MVSFKLAARAAVTIDSAASGPEAIATRSGTEPHTATPASPHDVTTSW